MYSSCCLCILDVWPFTEVELTRQGPHYWHLPLDNGVSPGVGLCDYLLSPVLGFCVAWPVQILGVLWQPRWVHVCMCPAVFGEHGFLAVTHCLWLLSSFGLFLWDAPRVFGGGAVIEMSHPVLITKLLWRWRLTQRGLTIGEGTENGDCGVPIPNGTIHHSILFDPSSLLISFPFLSSSSPSPTPLRHTHKFSPYNLDCPSAHNPLASAFQGWGTLWNLGSESSHKRQILWLLGIFCDWKIFCYFLGAKRHTLWKTELFSLMCLLSLLHILLDTLLKIGFCLYYLGWSFYYVLYTYI